MHEESQTTPHPARKYRKPTYLPGRGIYAKCLGFQATEGIHLADLPLRIASVGNNPNTVYLERTDIEASYSVLKRRKSRHDTKLFSKDGYTYFAWLAKTNGKLKLRIGFKRNLPKRRKKKKPGQRRSGSRNLQN